MKLIQTFFFADPDVFPSRSSQLNNSFLISFIWELQFYATAIKKGAKIKLQMGMIEGGKKTFDKKELKSTQIWSTHQETSSSAVERMKKYYLTIISSEDDDEFVRKINWKESSTKFKGSKKNSKVFNCHSALLVLDFQNAMNH